MKLKKLVFLAIVVSISIVLSIIESSISSFVFVIPGVKLGLANIMTLVVLFVYGNKDGGIVVLIRILLVGLIYSGLFTPTWLMSISGGFLAYLSMILIKRFPKLSITSVSVAGSLFHMIGQILMAIVVLDTATLIFYLPYMMLISVPTGIFTGLVAKKLIDVFQRQLINPEA